MSIDRISIFHSNSNYIIHFKLKLLLDLKNNKLRMTTTHFILEIKYVKVLIDLDNPFTFLCQELIQKQICCPESFYIGRRFSDVLSCEMGRKIVLPILIRSGKFIILTGCKCYQISFNVFNFSILFKFCFYKDKLDRLKETSIRFQKYPTTWRRYF